MRSFAEADTSTRDVLFRTTAPSSHVSRSILIVDDERPIVAFMRDLLEDEGYTVTPAYSGLEAIDILRHDPPALLISDVVMPGANAYDLLRFLQHSSRSTPPKIILMSANLVRSPRERIPLLRKPFDIDELLDLVNEMLHEGDDVRSA